MPDLGGLVVALFDGLDMVLGTVLSGLDTIVVHLVGGLADLAGTAVPLLAGLVG